MLGLLTQLCEGHNLAAQDLMLRQPMNASSVNILGRVTSLFCCQAETSDMLKLCEDAEADLMVKTVRCLSELVMGPCPGNQEFLSRDESFLNAIDKVLRSDFSNRLKRRDIMLIKFNTVTLLASLLEGQQAGASPIHRRLVLIFEPVSFEILHGYLAAALRLGAPEGREPTEAEMEMAGMAKEAGVCLERIREELSMASHKFQSMLSGLIPARPTADRLIGPAHSAESFVAEIEIQWLGRVEAVSFPLPKEVAYLSSGMKANFLATVNLSTTDKRNMALMNATPEFVNTMVQVRWCLHCMLLQNVDSVESTLVYIPPGMVLLAVGKRVSPLM